jgi:internalin A
LNLTSNDLTTLPECFSKLTRLQELYLSNNLITSLPEWLDQMTQLEVLDLSNNRLTSLPEAMRNLKSLTDLFLHGNGELGLPAEVLVFTMSDLFGGAESANPADILDYYFRVRGGKRPLNEAKLILVGRGTVGKTSLVNRLIHNQFEPHEKKTEGICITGWPLRLKDESVQLNVWDFGGQEIMHATHQFFLTERSLYLLVLNGREGGEDVDAEYWLKLIESFGGDSPVVVVLNKIKEHPFDVNRRALQQKYPIRDFVKTDCADGTGIEELRKIIERETDRLEHLRDAFPASWFSIKDQLAKMESNYLSFEEYRQFCEQQGETDEQAQNALAGYLHNLGIVLNYKDDPRLQDTHVLNPHWMTNGIYKILNSDKLSQQKGEIRLGDLPEILDAKVYPSGMRRFIFDLMKKFDLCFSFPDDDTHYLIPELLDKQEPEDTAEFKPEECLNFQYHYPVLPEGLLPRFIVRTHLLSEGLPRWRSGVILEFEGCRALVKADVQDRKVFISVTGPLENRRRLLAVIRSEFERIHHDIRNLQPQEMIPIPAYPNVVVSYKDLLLCEREGRPTYPVSISVKFLDLNVQELLSGVSLKGERRGEPTMEARFSEAVRLFISYSHKDDKLRDELQTHLKLLQREHVIDAWDDRRIGAGDEWKQRIDENLERANIILLLVSADFINSDYCYDKEMTRALERHQSGEARVIPVIVRDVNWKKAPFAKLQALPTDGKPVSNWSKKDSAWRNVSEGIEKVAEAIRQKS